MRNNLHEKLNDPVRQKAFAAAIAKDSGYFDKIKSKDTTNVEIYEQKKVSKRRNKNKAAKKSRKHNR